jgi:LuxR family transcriptional regulator, maltose regulon positive regulatory protein
MAVRLPTVEDDHLLLAEGEAAPLRVGSPDWVAWLDAAETRSFAFRAAGGRLTARKDARRRGGAYWVAYRKTNGALRNVYLGKSADVTLERLTAAAATLAAPPPSVAAPAADPAPLLRTKLYAARPTTALVARPRLVARLAAGAGRRLTLIVAPAGFGKTTLIGEWLHAGATPAAWLTLDDRDNDPALFWTYAIAALQTIFPGVGAAALHLLRRTPPPPLDRALTLLINDLAAQGDHAAGRALILDDYHVITAPAIHESLAFLLDQLPPGLRLVITSRHDPPLPLARLRARAQLLELRAADLRFAPAESAAFLNDVMGLRLEPADIAALERRTEGWIAGLQLAALSMQDHSDRAGFIRALGGSHRFVLDYLMEEVLARQPAPVLRFLLQASVLDRLSAPLCEATIEPSAGAPGARHAKLSAARQPVLDAAR